MIERDPYAVLRSLPAALRVSNGSVRAGKYIREKFNRYPKPNPLSKEFLRILDLDSGASKSFRVSSVHPAALPFTSSESDLDALAALLDPKLAAVVAELGLLGKDDTVTIDLDDDIVLIGSPEAEPLTRLLFGYEALPDAYGMTYRGDTLPLIYRWEEEWESAKHANCFQRRANGSIAVRPNWPLVKMCPKKITLYPRLAGDFLLEDFLIITKVPNFLTEEAWQRGRAILSVAGLHSTGTRAAALALEDERLLEDLVARVAGLPPGSRWLQIVVAITEIDHFHERGSMPVRATVHDVVSLDLSDEDLLSARKAVQRSLATWQLALEANTAAAKVPGRLGFEVEPPFTAEKQELLNVAGSAAERLSSLTASAQHNRSGIFMQKSDRSVFIVHGRNLEAKNELVKFLKHMDAKPISWGEAAAATNKPRPYTMDIVEAGMRMAQAIVVLFSPDDEAKLKDKFLKSGDGPHEREFTGQARQNVILEAGMAMAMAHDRTIFVRIGNIREISDISGINWIDLDDGWENRKRLCNELVSAGVKLDTSANLQDPDAGSFKSVDV